MKVVLYDKIYVDLSEMDPYDLEKVERRFTESNPKFFFFKKSGYSTYNVPKEIVMYGRSGKYHTFPIGSLDELRKTIEWYDYKLEIDDRRVEGEDIDFQFNPEVTMEDYQDEIREAMHSSKWSNGVIESPPGSGKTFTALKYISEIKKKTLIIVHENRLLRQWEMEVQDHGRGLFTFGSFSSDGHNFADITVVLIQSGFLYKDSYPEFNTYGCVIVDECHHTSSETYVKLLNKLPCKYKFGVSGTTERTDNMHFMLSYYLGPLLIDIPPSRVKNRVTDFDIEFVTTGATFEVPFKKGNIYKKNGKREYAKVDYTKLLEIITGFPGSTTKLGKTLMSDPDELVFVGYEGKHGVRNKRIVEKVKANVEMGHFPLVLTNRVLHAKFFIEALKRENITGIIFTGETSRDYDLREIRKSPTVNGESFSFIVATERIAAEALDIAYLSSLHLLTPTKNENKVDQCLGRIRRRNSEKLHPIVFDYVDREDGRLESEEDYFEQSAKKRRKDYLRWKSEYAQA